MSDADITTGPDYGTEAQQLLALADELMRARDELLRAEDTSAYEGVKQVFVNVLWADRMTIIFALRKAAGDFDMARGRRPIPDEQKVKFTTVAVDTEAVATLNAAADELEKSFGFRPTLSQTLRHLLRKMAS